MLTLSQEERDCLRKIAGSHSEILCPCPEPVIERLMDLGLIEQCGDHWLPLESMNLGLHLTALGEDYLRQG